MVFSCSRCGWCVNIGGIHCFGFIMGADYYDTIDRSIGNTIGVKVSLFEGVRAARVRSRKQFFPSTPALGSNRS